MRVVSEIGKNHLAKTVLLHLDREKSLWVLEEAKIQNLNGFFQSQTPLSSLNFWNKQYVSVIRGHAAYANAITNRIYCPD